MKEEDHEDFLLHSTFSIKYAPVFLLQLSIICIIISNTNNT